MGSTSILDDQVEAGLVFVDPAKGEPISYTHEPERNVGDFKLERVKVRDARKLGRDLSLDREGFVLRQHRSEVTDFHDYAEVERIYYPEMEKLVREETGASFVHVFGHAVRMLEVPVENFGTFRLPAYFQHTDYTPQSALAAMRELLPAEQAERLSKHRFSEINVWRPVTGPLRSKPLAVVDGSTLRTQDLLRAQRISAVDTGEYYAIAWNPEQRWYFFPDMMPDEVLLLKCYDTDPSRCQYGGHGAMDTHPPDALPRHSVEIRAFAFYE